MLPAVKSMTFSASNNALKPLNNQQNNPKTKEEKNN